MIFVTVGTHEQPFNRLIEYIDNIKNTKNILEEIIIQTGYSTYSPLFCKWKQFYSFQDMMHLVNDARIVITHGGPSSFIMPLHVGKIPIVVPRSHKYNEHINDHQITFCQNVEERIGNIIVVEDVNNLYDVIKNYNSIVNKMNLNIKSNNASFNARLEKIVEKMFDKNK